MPGSSCSRAASSAAPRSRAGSPYWATTCSPSQISPLSRSIAGAAAGSRVQSWTVRSAWSPVSGNGAVAEGTSSRSATMSHSDGSPSKGRATNTEAAPPGAPWQAL